MRTLEVYKLSFEPKNAPEKVQEILKNKTASILWCAIKAGHITDQYFNQEVLEVAKSIDSSDTNDYKVFLGLCERLTNLYGRVNVYDTSFNKQYEKDHEFWGDIFKAIHRQRCFRTEVELSEINKKDLPEANVWEGCGDHSCKVRAPKGQGMNGGCRCHDMEPKKAISQLYLDREYFRKIAKHYSYV